MQNAESPPKEDERRCGEYKKRVLQAYDGICEDIDKDVCSC